MEQGENGLLRWNVNRFDGCGTVNLLVLAVVYRGAAIPVHWLPLNKGR